MLQGWIPPVIPCKWLKIPSFEPWPVIQPLPPLPTRQMQMHWALQLTLMLNSLQQSRGERRMVIWLCSVVSASKEEHKYIYTCFRPWLLFALIYQHEFYSFPGRYFEQTTHSYNFLYLRVFMKLLLVHTLCFPFAFSIPTRARARWILQRISDFTALCTAIVTSKDQAILHSKPWFELVMWACCVIPWLLCSDNLNAFLQSLIFYLCLCKFIPHFQERAIPFSHIYMHCISGFLYLICHVFKPNIGSLFPAAITN